MSASHDSVDELCELLAALREDTIANAQARRLVELLRGNPAARRTYIHYMAMVADLRGSVANSRSPYPPFSDTEQGATDQQATIDKQQTLPPPIVVDLSASSHHSLLSLQSPLVSGLFSYVAAAVIVGIAVLIGWTWRIHYDQQLTQNVPRQVPNTQVPETSLVGRITDTVDCRWAEGTTEAFDRESVPLGRRYVLASGFIEITYNTGARVILQGPATYQVESANSGFLSVGKLTARVENRESSVESGSRKREHSRLATLNSPLFSVRTPTAIVTDLGTEFGVEVDRTGTSRAHVFQGKIELRIGYGGSTSSTDSRGITAPGTPGSGRVVQLNVGDTATVEHGRRQDVRVVRDAGQLNVPAFVRRLPQWVPIKVFSTGVGLAVGDEDPHWQIVAWNDDPEFLPRPAVAEFSADGIYLMNDPARSLWISFTGRMSTVPDGKYTFRTTFELTGVSPESAALEGRFVADNHVNAIRLNGHAAQVPKHGSVAPFTEFHSFRIDKGFVPGMNVLEFDVFNSPPVRPKISNPMGLMVELKGFARRGSR